MTKRTKNKELFLNEHFAKKRLRDAEEAAENEGGDAE